MRLWFKEEAQKIDYVYYYYRKAITTLVIKFLDEIMVHYVYMVKLNP